MVIVEDDRFDATASITVCGFTIDPTEAPLFRLPIEPAAENGLAGPSRLMADDVTTVACANLGRRIGLLDDTDMLRLNRSIVVFLGLDGR